jgi:hypothetical protein
MRDYMTSKRLSSGNSLFLCQASGRVLVRVHIDCLENTLPLSLEVLPFGLSYKSVDFPLLQAFDLGEGHPRPLVVGIIRHKRLAVGPEGTRRPIFIDETNLEGFYTWTNSPGMCCSVGYRHTSYLQSGNRKDGPIIRN